MGIDGREKFISLSARKPGWQNDPDLRSDVLPETHLENEQISALLDAVMTLLPEEDVLALKQTYYKDWTFQKNRRILKRGNETAEQVTRRALERIKHNHPEIRDSLFQLLGGPRKIVIPEQIKIKVPDNVSGGVADKIISREQFEEEVMKLFVDGKYITPIGIADELDCNRSLVYFVIISKLYEREMAARSGVEQAQMPNKNPDTGPRLK